MKTSNPQPATYRLATAGMMLSRRGLAGGAAGLALAANAGGAGAQPRRGGVAGTLPAGTLPIGNLRVAEGRFAGLPDWPFAPHYADVLGTRMHYVDEGRGRPVLMLHGEPSWGYLYRHFIPPVVAAGHRVVVPDHVGFGRSDKWKLPGRYTFTSHYAQLEELIVGQLELNDITLVCQDWGGMLGLTLAGHYPDRFARLVIMNTMLGNPPRPDPAAAPAPVTRPGTWRANSQAILTNVPELGEFFRKSPGNNRELSDAEVAAYSAPWPDKPSRVSALRFPQLFGNSTDPEDPGVELMREAHTVMQSWTKPVLLMWGDSDPVFPIATAGAAMHRLFKTSNPPIPIVGGRHFVQEADPKRISTEIVRFIGRA